MTKSSNKRSWLSCLMDFEQGAMTKSDWRRQKRFLLCTLSWAMSYVICNWLLKSDTSWPSWQLLLIILAPLVLGAAAIMSYIHFLGKADELVQRVHYHGIAVGFGLGILYSVAYQLMLTAGIETKNYTIAVMSVGWSLGVLRASWRYR